MHIVMFGDQHLTSQGGAQVSMRLQKRFLERAGHTVTVVAPGVHAGSRDAGRHAGRDAGGDAGRDAGGDAGGDAGRDAGFLDLPSVPITLDREYSLTVPGRRTDRRLDEAMASRPPVDVVHVQADFWGAVIGHRFAQRHALPVVHTMHNRVDVGIRAVAPFPVAVLRVLNAWQRRALRTRRGERGGGARSDGWSYLRRFADRSAAVTAPSSHFARRLEQHDVVPASGRVDVVWNGIDDDILDAVSASGGPRLDGPARFVWVGRMSPEKRLLPFLEAVAASGVHADVQVIGGGGQARAAQRLVQRRRPAASVVFAGRLPYPETLRRIAAADAVVQTSIGFETQGMTVFEAAALGTPSVISDPDIAREVGAGVWTMADASTAALADALRRAAADIDAGTAPEPDADVAERFRQSSRTAVMVEIYERVLAAGQ